MNTLALLVLLLLLGLGGCDYQSARDKFDRQIDVCSVAEDNGLLEAAVEACGAALAIAEEHSYEQSQISGLLYRLGRLERQRGRFREAEALVNRSLVFEEQSGNSGALASRLVELSFSLSGQGRWSDGAQALERVVPLVDYLTDKVRHEAANAFRVFSTQLDKMGYTAMAEQFKVNAEELEVLRVQ